MNTDEQQRIFDRWLNAHEGLLFKVVHAYSRKSHDREDLFQEIEGAIAKDDLSKPTKAAIHHVREIGNWGAHPNEDQASVLIEVTEDEARYTLEVVELLFNDLYVTPQKVASMGIAIGQKQTGQEQPQAASNPKCLLLPSEAACSPLVAFCDMTT